MSKGRLCVFGEVLFDHFPDGQRVLGGAPFNVSFLLALVCCVLVWLLVWRTKFGYEMRTMGHSPTAARYAGMKEARIIIITMIMKSLAMAISGWIRQMPLP